MQWHRRASQPESLIATSALQGWCDAGVGRLQVAADDVLLLRGQEGEASSDLIWATKAKCQVAVDYAARKAGCKRVGGGRCPS
jgi:hypothetical protein